MMVRKKRPWTIEPMARTIVSNVWLLRRDLLAMMVQDLEESYVTPSRKCACRYLPF